MAFNQIFRTSNVSFCFVNTPCGEISTSVKYVLYFTTFTSGNPELHLRNSLIPFQEFRNSTLRVQLVEFNFWNFKKKSTKSTSAETVVNSWVQEFEYVNSRCLIREHLKLDPWIPDFHKCNIIVKYNSLIPEVGTLSSWSRNCKFLQ